MNYTVAHIGLYPTFGGYLHSYESAVDHLFRAIESGQSMPDKLAMPLLALMRQSMELGYKFTITELNQALNEKGFDANKYGHHNLPALHRELCALFARVVERYEIPKDIVQSFDDYRLKTETAMNEFDSLDKGSFSFRYPINKAGTIHFTLDKTVDIAQMKASFDGAMVLLHHTADVVTPYVDYHLEMQAIEAENYAWW